MLPNGCWGDVHDFSNHQKPSLASLCPKHHPQHGHDPGHFCLDRGGFAVPSRRMGAASCAVRCSVPSDATVLEEVVRHCPVLVAGHGRVVSHRPWERRPGERVVGSVATALEVAAQWPAGPWSSAGGRDACWGCPRHPPGIGRRHAHAVFNAKPLRGLLPLTPWPSRAHSGGGGGGGGVRAASCVAVRWGRCSAWS